MNFDSDENLRLIKELSEKLHRHLEQNGYDVQARMSCPCPDELTNRIIMTCPGPIIYMSETLNFGVDIVSKDDLEVTRKFWSDFAENVDNHGIGEREFWKGLRPSLSKSYWQDPVIGDKLLEMDRKIFGERPDYTPPFSEAALSSQFDAQPS